MVVGLNIVIAVVLVGAVLIAAVLAQVLRERRTDRQHSTSNVAPLSWAISDHVSEGREAVNYSEFDRPQEEALWPGSVRRQDLQTTTVNNTTTMTEAALQRPRRGSVWNMTDQTSSSPLRLEAELNAMTLGSVDRVALPRELACVIEIACAIRGDEGGKR